jgi:hypothetical protein
MIATAIIAMIVVIRIPIVVIAIIVMIHIPMIPIVVVIPIVMIVIVMTPDAAQECRADNDRQCGGQCDVLFHSDPQTNRDWPLLAEG